MEELLEVLRGALPQADLSDTAKNLLEEGEITSIDIITIVSELTDHYDLEIPAEEMEVENFTSVDSIFAMLRRIEEEA